MVIKVLLFIDKGQAVCSQSLEIYAPTHIHRN